MPDTPYVETRTQIRTEQPSLSDALTFIAHQREGEITDVQLSPTLNDPGKWTVSVRLRTDNLEDQA